MVTSLGATAAFQTLVAASPAHLRAAMQRGTMPDPGALVGREFRGANTPRMSAPLGIRRFVKGFRPAEHGGCVGYNVRVTGADLTAPWTTTQWRGKREFGFFLVRPVDPDAVDNQHLNALLLDYAGTGAAAGPLSGLRDYLVLVDPARELMLGRALLAVGPLRVPLGYFVLEPLEPRSG
jgi:hypothetical protein